MATLKASYTAHFYKTPLYIEDIYDEVLNYLQVSNDDFLSQHICSSSEYESGGSVDFENLPSFNKGP